VTLIGYTMMGEQAGPKQLVRDVALAEEAGFDFAVISDHSAAISNEPFPRSVRRHGAATIRDHHRRWMLMRG